MGADNLKLEDGEDPPSEMPSVSGPVPLGAEAGSSSGALPFEPPSDPMVRRFQEEMAQVEDEPDLVEGEGALIKQEGKVYHVRNAATVQRWIVERRVLRDDLISTGGAGWEPVGQHPDLEIFFQMVERLDQLEQSGSTAHSVGPPVPDGSALGNAWADREQPDESSLEMPDEEEEEEDSDVISAPSDFPSDTPSEPLVGLDSAPLVTPDGPTMGYEEAIEEPVEDPDSDVAALPFALRSATRGAASQPAMVTVPEVVATEEVPLPSGSGLIGMVGTDDEVTQGKVTSEPPALPPIAPLPVGIGPGRGFDEQAFFQDELEPLRISDPEPTVKMEPAPSGSDVLAWEEERGERRMRWGLRIGVVLVLVLIAAVWWVTQLPPADVVETPPVAELEGEQGEEGTTRDPSADPAVGEQGSADQVAADKAAADKIAADKAAADKAAADKAAADKAAADKALADKAAADKAAADKAAADKARDKERRASTAAPTERKAPVNTDKGWSAVQSGDYNTARLVFVEAVAAKPGDADAHFGLGYAAHRQGDDSTAIRHYCKALKLAPGNREIQQEAKSLLSSLDATCS